MRLFILSVLVLFNSTKASANTAPFASIVQPTTTTTYNVGMTIAYAGVGIDVEDGALPASAFTWQIDFHHDNLVTTVFGPASGSIVGNFTIPNSGITSTNVFYRFILTVTDSGGMTAGNAVDIYPNPVVPAPNPTNTNGTTSLSSNLGNPLNTSVFRHAMADRGGCGFTPAGGTIKTVGDSEGSGAEEASRAFMSLIFLGLPVLVAGFRRYAVLFKL